jgi:hypothetical protein
MTVESTDGAHRKVRLTRASLIKPRPVRWVWEDNGEGRIPVGEITSTPGRGGVGKSTFHVWTIAQLTQGTLPGIHFGTPKPCIVAATEDSWACTIVPRLMAAGADLDLVYRVDVTTEADEVVTLSLPLDIDALEEEITREGVALLSSDPLISMVSDRLDSHKDAEVRRALEPLRGMADRTRCAVLGNAHFNKSGGQDLLALIMGSSAFANVPRAALGFARDTEAEDGSCVITQFKNNLGRTDLPSLRYRIDQEFIATDEGPAKVGKLVMLGESERSVNDVLRDTSRTDDPSENRDAASWIRGYLERCEGGSANSADVLTAGESAGYSKKTLMNVRRKVADTAQSGFGKDTVHTWILHPDPTPDPLDPGHGETGSKGSGRDVGGVNGHNVETLLAAELGAQVVQERAAS